MNVQSPEVVDCERHVVIPTIEDLVPYLDTAWAERLTTSEFRLPPPSAAHPGVQLEAVEPPPTAFDPELAAADLGTRTTAAILVPSQALVTAGWLNHSMAAAFVSAMNDYVVDRWLPAAPRFRFAIVVSAHDAERAAAEIHRLGHHPAAVAVCLSPIAVGMGQPHYHPIYEAAQELGLPVMVHPSGFEGTTAGPAMLGGVGPRTPEEIYTLLPQVGAVNLASLVFDGIFVRYPRLTVVLAGLGFDWAVSALWRSDAEWRGLRVEAPWLTRAPSSYVADHVKFVVDGSTPFTGPELWSIADSMPEDSLLWGSDEPFHHRDCPSTLAHAPEGRHVAIAAATARSVFPRLPQAALEPTPNREVPTCQ